LTLLVLAVDLPSGKTGLPRCGICLASHHWRNEQLASMRRCIKRYDRRQADRQSHTEAKQDKATE
jgi:hypothetical protein